jgi:hypothetical protein
MRYEYQRPTLMGVQAYLSLHCNNEQGQQHSDNSAVSESEKLKISEEANRGHFSNARAIDNPGRTTRQIKLATHQSVLINHKAEKGFRSQV